jgi:hypothetical protein
MRAVGISQAEIARRAGVSRPAVCQAVRRGALDLAADGKVDDTGPRSRAWLDRHAGKLNAPRVNGNGHASGNGSVGAAVLAGMSATLHGREYDWVLWQHNVVDAAEVRDELYEDAALWEQTARKLPVWAGCHIALLLGVSPDTTAPHIARAIDAFLIRAGDQRALVDRTIAKVAAAYRDYPISRLAPAPPVPEHIMPETEAEARDRLALVRGELVGVRMAVRAGSLLCVAPARFQIASLHLRWMEALAEEFPVSYGPDILTAGGHWGQDLVWGFWQLVSSLVIPQLRVSWPDAKRRAAGDFSSAAKVFGEARWRRDGLPTKETVAAVRAADAVRVEQCRAYRGW